MSQFTKFSELAQELQDQIWDMAIRDDEPAAQFFTIYDRDWTFAQCPVGLTAPHQSWIDGNKSAYATDSGLWTACWGSRARMLARFKPAETSALMARIAPVRPQAARKICRRPTASVTMPFKREGASSQRKCYLTIKPMEDLLYFEFAGGPVPHTDNYYWKFLKGIPEFRWKLSDGGKARGWHAPLHVRHIAVEYDPDWRDSRSYFAAQMRPRAGDIPGLEMFWLVDYSLRRRFRVDLKSSRRDRRTFRAGDDHEFVEVLEQDKEWWDQSTNYTSAGFVRSYGKSAAHDLATQMEADVHVDQLIADMDAAFDAYLGDDSEVDNHSNSLDVQGEDGAHTGWDGTAKRTPSRFGVLAYVKRGSERNLPTAHEWFQKNTGAI